MFLFPTMLNIESWIMELEGYQDHTEDPGQV